MPTNDDDDDDWTGNLQRNENFCKNKNAICHTSPTMFPSPILLQHRRHTNPNNSANRIISLSLISSNPCFSNFHAFALYSNMFSTPIRCALPLSVHIHAKNCSTISSCFFILPSISHLLAYPCITEMQQLQCSCCQLVKNGRQIIEFSLFFQSFFIITIDTKNSITKTTPIFCIIFNLKLKNM